MVNDSYIPGQRLAQAIARGDVDPGKVLFQLAPALPHETGGIPLPLPRMLFTQAAPAVQTPLIVPEQVIPQPAAATAPAPAPTPEPPSMVAATPQPVISSSRPLDMNEYANGFHRPATYIVRPTQL